MSLRTRFKKKNDYPFSKTLLHELSELFFCEGYKLYSGQNSLSLTGQFLGQFLIYYDSYSTNQSQNLIRSSLRFNVKSAAKEMNYIRECFEKVQCLKLIVDVRYPFENPIQLFPFDKIKVLVIKKCPVNMIYGLKRLRRQLQTFVLNYSISLFDEVIADCGGDQAEPEEWMALDELDLSYNSIIEIKDSRLSLVHSITKLDLSHNQLSEERTDFRELDKLLQINLGYNFLKHIPFFHAHTMVSIHTLILRNNNLSALDGVETLRQLSVLDLGYNCLDLHMILDRLDALHFLQNLQLIGNPLSYHKRHRQLTLFKLSHAIDVETFILDDVTLSISETKEFLRNVQLNASYHSSLSSPSHLNFFSSSSSQSHSSSRGRRISSIRTIELDDTDSQRGSVIEDFRQIEIRDRLTAKGVLRTQMGPAWLSSQEESPQRITKPVHRSKHKQTHHTLPSPTKAILNEVTTSSSKPNSPIVKSKLKEGKDNSLPESQQSYQIEAFVDNYSPMLEYPDLVTKECQREDETSARTPVNVEEVSIHNSPHLIDEEQYLVYSYDTDDEESQREPFFISLSCNRLYELNYEGKSIQDYDMNCLESAVQSEKRPNSPTQNETRQILSLKFNYQRRDMRKREYIFEKAQNFELLIKKLQDIAIDNAKLNPLKSTYECLKCNSVYEKTQMLYSYPINEHSNDSSQSVINCPQCGSQQLTDDSKLSVKDRELVDSGTAFVRKMTPVEIRTSYLDNSIASPKTSLTSKELNRTKRVAISKKESSYFSENKVTKYRKKSIDEIQAPDDTFESDYEMVLRKKESAIDVLLTDNQSVLENAHRNFEADKLIDFSNVKSSEKVVGKGSFRRRDKQPYVQLSDSMIANDARGLTKTHIHTDDTTSNFRKPFTRPRVNTSPLEDLQENSSQSDSERRNSVLSHGSFIFPSRTSTGPEGIGLPFSFHDPSHIRHDFKLYIEVKLFENHSEEFFCQIRCTAVQTRIREEFECLLIISTQAAYICQVKGYEEQSPSEWLSKLARISLTNLFFIDIGLHAQTIQLEFNRVKNGSFVFVTRDTLRTKIFVASLSGYVAKLKNGNLQRVGNDLQTIPNFRASIIGNESGIFSEKFVLGLRFYEIIRYTSDLIKTHRFNKRTVHNTINGAKLVDFLIQRGEVSTIEEACIILQIYIDCKILNPVELSFEPFNPERNVYYRFFIDELDPQSSSINRSDIQMLNEIEELEVYCLLYQLEYKLSNPLPEKKTIGLAITEDNLYLINQNFQWPLPRLQPPPQLGIRWRQFELQDKRRLTDIEKIIINSISQNIVIVFSTESITDSPHYHEWNLCTESSRMAEQIVSTIKTTWEKQYNIELNILVTDKLDDNL
ncbi:Serine/threonine-protein kinase 11-interacting protein [Oopsacas minuta]|uniref:Serine/threonine-protein kinase 11-interacting protein n=1 Tax=Oopsacas minuta TaxID=111878 RepID=A0AAV7JXC6_9METZ|nr:Serine/threonine-protein kinase 11-interacting protein [Oopsacas minuta]